MRALSLLLLMLLASCGHRDDGLGQTWKGVREVYRAPAP